MNDTFEKWTFASFDEITMVVLSSIVTYAVILLYTRLSGLRSFSKMSASDFAMTVAVGSLFASTISSSTPTLFIGIAAIGCLFAGQWGLAILRQQIPWLSQLIDNEPLLLMVGGEMIEENLRKANVTRSDIYGKLRESNAFSYDQILAVVFETTGDISVIHSERDDAVIDPDIVGDVIGHERLFSGQRSAAKK
ncbi:uncharacterized membrane protein YcaP (DUF421 family) [Rhodopirellula rubra]|uniref:Uncharacterized membrane protein YcaP (DUF421 family) n=1 Tax=Aporhodopirellula rubra TaxID=980271 RepID=A0A7W5DXP1_9BACT|nr:YetF domain-containing protein [Aporhodopirellula rubra]MBB3206119.1 uncharacterized membrane protein YcaP (DUF421 family) [Aporhodopirellula rubra]